MTSALMMVVIGEMRGSFISRTISLMAFLTSSLILSYLTFAMVLLAVAEGAGGLPAPSAGFVFYRLTSTISNASMVSPSRISLKFSMPMPHS